MSEGHIGGSGGEQDPLPLGQEHRQVHQDIPGDVALLHRRRARPECEHGYLRRERMARRASPNGHAIGLSASRLRRRRHAWGQASSHLQLLEMHR